MLPSSQNIPAAQCDALSVFFFVLTALNLCVVSRARLEPSFSPCPYRCMENHEPSPTTNSDPEKPLYIDDG